jgi:hypothetical protein
MCIISPNGSHLWRANVASPFSADIIPLPLLGAKQGRSELPGSGPASVRRIPVRDLHAIFDERPNLIEQLREAPEPRSPINAHNLALVVLSWLVIGGCYLLIVSGAL